MTSNHLFGEVDRLSREGQSVAMCTIVRAHGSVPRHVGSKMLVRADGSISGTIGGGEMESRVIATALDALLTGEGQVVEYQLVDSKAGDPGVCGGAVEVFVEPIKPEPALLVIGGGHVGAALVHLGKWLGFRVMLNDDRAAFCTPEAVPGADEYIVGSVDKLLEACTFHDQMYIVLATRGVPIDLPLLPKLLERPHAYLGVIGSRRRWATTAGELTARGVEPQLLAGVHAPIGLELNAETPAEIAVSIMAEIIMHLRGGTGETMKIGSKALARAALQDERLD